MSDFKPEWVTFQPHVFFDVGSYNGTTALQFKQRFPECRIVAIEASPKNFARMQANKKLCGIEILHYGVSDRDGEITFHDTSGRLTGSGSIHRPNKLLHRFGSPDKPLVISEVTVPGIRLDTLCRRLGIEHVDVVHMDIQGAEFEALCGLGDLRPRLLFVELGGSTINTYDGTTDPTERLKAMGYDLLVRLPGDQLWGRDHDPLVRDILASHRRDMEQSAISSLRRSRLWPMLPRWLRRWIREYRAAARSSTGPP